MSAPVPPGEWLLVLPDHPEGHSVAALFGTAPQRVDHPSGRPWLLGRWSPGDLRVAVADRHRSLAVLGPCSATTAHLREIAGRTGDPVTLDGLASAGSFHLMASVDGVSRFQGSVSGLRRVFRARVGRLTVAADRADVLAALLGSEVDRRRLAVRLLVSESALASLNESLWTDVRVVDEDSCLLQFPDGRGVVRRRWTPPPDDRPLPEAARALRTALVESVRLRADAGKPVTADLSGGLDSTTLCFLAAAGGRPLTTLSFPPVDAGDEDPMWADRAAEHLPGLSRLRLTDAELPSVYSDLLEPGPRTDEPFPGVEDRPIHRAVAARLRAAGSGIHLNGEGGDEVLTAGATGVLELARRHPLTAVRHLRAYRAFEHWRWRDVAEAVWDRRGGYPAWLGRRARSLAVAALDDDRAVKRTVLPPWATAEAAGLVRDELLAETGTTRPQGPDWTTHHTVLAIRQSATLARGLRPVHAAEGVEVASPYLDDTVIAACLTAPAHLRSNPWAYKALLRTAMRGLVPDRCLERTTKAEGSSAEYAGLRENSHRLAALCDGSRLGRMGLIDPAALRAACTGTGLRALTPYAISLTMSVERWLRDLEAPPDGDGPSTEGARAVPSTTNGRPR